MIGVTSLARRIALLNYKINKANRDSITYETSYDKKQLANEREKMLMLINSNYPDVDGEVIVAKVESKFVGNVDVFDLINMIETCKKKTTITDDVLGVFR